MGPLVRPTRSIFGSKSGFRTQLFPKLFPNSAVVAVFVTSIRLR
jgi:hypothetical protein